jgi:phosphoribosylglycinamide formyltransferase 2
MVTLAGTQNLSEFELHARAILGYPIPEIKLEHHGASAVLLASDDEGIPFYEGIEEVLKHSNTDIRIFNKPVKRKYRRMGVVLVNDTLQSDVDQVKEKAVALSKLIQIK